MKTAIFIRSFYKDAPWLSYCLRSIRKYVTGFEYTIVVIPSRDSHIFTPMKSQYNIRLYEYSVHPNKPMLSSEVQLCHADSICADVDAVCTLDSDCVFMAPSLPGDYLVGGKPVLLGQRYDKITEANRIWQSRVETALGFKPLCEFMRHPTIFLRSTFKPFREAVEKHTSQPFANYVLSGPDKFPQTFAELSSLGAFAALTFPENYFAFDLHAGLEIPKADSGELITAWKLRQFYSHGGVTESIRKELEEICK